MIEKEIFHRRRKEFMEKIIKANNIELPMLPLDEEYQYDEKNAKLVIVKKKAAEQPAKKS